jgi:hypothetical protein
MTASRPSPISRWAPLVSVGLLVGLLLTGGISARRPIGTDEYRARIRAALEAVPLKIGPAVGQEVEPTPAAVRLLSPNKILSRSYMDPGTGESFSLLVVHCGDVRDMEGHYPPNCYPANGWKLTGSEQVGIEVAGERANAKRYYFKRADELIERRMSVVDFFVIPEEGATLFDDMNAVERASRSSDLGGLGVAQVQIAFGGDVPQPWRDQIVRETLKALAPAVRAIAQGIKK